MNDSPAVVPPSINRLAAQISQELGHQATAQPLPEVRRWRITVNSPRVTVTLDYTIRQRGRALQAGSTLTIDGQAVPLADDIDHLAAIFADPDTASRTDTATSDSTPAPLASTCEPDDAPPEVRRVYQLLTTKLGSGTQGRLRIGRSSRGYWCVAIEHPRVDLCMFFWTRLRRDGNAERIPDGIQLFVDGTDRSAEAAGRLDRALGLMAPAFTAAPAAPPAPPSRQAPVGPSNAVRERRNAVIRQ